MSNENAFMALVSELDLPCRYQLILMLTGAVIFLIELLLLEIFLSSGGLSDLLVKQELGCPFSFKVITDTTHKLI